MKKLFLFFLFFLLGLFFTPFTSFAASNHLLIVSIQIKGETSSQDFIKIYNPQNNSLDISGYRLRKRSSTGKEHSIKVFPKGSVIAPQGYYLWANSKDNYAKAIGANIESTATISKNNSIALLDQEKSIIDSLCWGKSQNPFGGGNCFSDNPSENQQLERIKINNEYQDTNNSKNDFKLNPPSEKSPKSSLENSSPENYSEETSSALPLFTNLPPVAKAGNNVFAQEGEEIYFDGSSSFDPDKDSLSFRWNFGDGETSDLMSPTHIYSFPGQYVVTLEVSDGKEKSLDKLIASILARGVILNEVFPGSPGQEGWIEILNTNDFIVDISRWEIKDSTGKTFSLPQNSFIMPHQFLVLENDITGLSLDNKGGSVSFSYPTALLIEKLNYPETNKGWSLSKNSEGDFVFSPMPTPRLSNLFPSSTQNIVQKTAPLEKTVQDNKAATTLKISPSPASLLSGSAFSVPKKTFNAQKAQSSLKSSLDGKSLFLIAAAFSFFSGLAFLALKRKFLDRT